MALSLSGEVRWLLFARGAEVAASLGKMMRMLDEVGGGREST